MKQGQTLKKQVWIAIESEQDYEGAEPAQMSMVCSGTLYQRKGIYYISYEESELTGLENTRTMLKIQPEQVTMTRSGKYPSQMLFIENQRHVGLYQTGYGTLEIAIHTAKIENEIDENGGFLSLEYTIELDHHVAGYNRFSIELKSKEEDTVQVQEEKGHEFDRTSETTGEADY